DNCAVNGASLSSDAPANMPLAVRTTTLISYTTLFRSNSASCTQTVTVSDDEKPSITCPAPVTQTADAGKCYATVASLGSPTTADNWTGNGVSFSNVALAYMHFAVCTTTVTWTVSDIHG